MAGNKDLLLGLIREGRHISRGQRVRLTLLLCGPAIMAQLASVLLEFIDASMVGSLGAAASASIGLVSTTTWIFNGFCIALGQGFSVQLAHRVGAGDFFGARSILRQGMLVVIAFSLILALAGVAIAEPLPRWLGGEASIRPDASAYFLIYAAFLPFMQIGLYGSTMLECSGERALYSDVCAGCHIQLPAHIPDARG